MYYYIVRDLLMSEVEEKMVVFDEKQNKVFVFNADERYAWELFKEGALLNDVETKLTDLGIENAHEFLQSLIHYNLIYKNE